jgi:hypothetical protein
MLPHQSGSHAPLLLRERSGLTGEGGRCPRQHESRSRRRIHQIPGIRQARVWLPVGWDRAGGLVGCRLASPAVALIVGAGRAWTVSMTSELSIPCR